MRLLRLIAILVFFSPAAAFAADPGTVVNLQHLVDLVFTILGSLMTLVIIPWLAAKILDRLHIDKQSALAQRLIQAAQNAAAVGLAQLQNVADAHASVDVKNQIAANGVNYVLNGGFKPVLDKLGINEDHLQEIILAQVQKLLPAQMAAVPAPAAPPPAPAPSVL